MRNRPLLQLTLISIVAAIVGIAISLLIDWFPASASEEAEPIDTLYDVLLIVSTVIFVLVMAVAIYSVVKFRARPGDQRDGPPIHGNAKLEVVWVTIPFLLVSALAVYGWVVLVDIEEPEPDAMVVEVRAEQFAWSFAYPDEDDGPAVETNDLMLPVDRQVELRIDTQDVIHSFWVPAFRLKSDAVPGLTTAVRVTPSEEGSFDVVCAELCGIGHSTMRQSVTVVPAGEFDTWLADRQEALAAEDTGGEEPDGEQSPSGVAGQAPTEEEAPADEPESGGGAGDAEPGGGTGRDGASGGDSESGGGDAAGGGGDGATGGRPEDSSGPGDA